MGDAEDGEGGGDGEGAGDAGPRTPAKATATPPASNNSKRPSAPATKSAVFLVFDPELIVTLTELLGCTSLPAAGYCLTIPPAGTVSLGASFWSPSLKPTAASSLLASERL